MENNGKELRVLGIGFDYQSIVAAQTRGDFFARFEEICRHVDRLVRIIYCPARDDLKPIRIGDNAEVIFTNSKSKMHFFFDSIRIAKRLQKEEGFDLVTAEDPLISGLAGWLIKRAVHLPFNIQLFDNRINNPFWLGERKRNNVLNELAKWSLKRADTIRVVANRTKDDFIKIGIPKERIFLVPTILNVQRFSDVDAKGMRTKFLGEQYDRIALFVGRLSQEKDMPTLLLAFKQTIKEYPRTLLLIVGGGPLELEIKALVKEQELESQVHFTGPVPYDDVPKYFATCDFVVLSSLHEGRPRVIAEAAISGKPVISTDAGDAREYIKDGQTGFIVPIQDSDRMAKRMADLLADSELMVRFGKAARQHMEEILKVENNPDLLVKCWKRTKEK